jgi:1,4-alpha-glucan branching enzyme
MAKSGKNHLLFVCNYTPVERENYRVGVPVKKKYKLLLNSADPVYGGGYEIEKMEYTAPAKEWDGEKYSIGYRLPPLSVTVFLF